jgi:hypothetical protein
MVDFRSHVLDRPGVARDLAKRLLAHETPQPSDAAQAIAGAEQVLDNLREQLVRWFGVDGAQALLSRALDRARAEQPALAHATIESRGRVRLRSLGEATGGSSETLHTALIQVVTGVLTLLARLIGADMVERVVQQAWPGEGFIQSTHLARTGPADAGAQGNLARASDSE